MAFYWCYWFYFFILFGSVWAGNLYDRIVGDITKGVRTTETLLKEGMRVAY